MTEPGDDHKVSDEAEYAALTGFLGTANGFRFTVLGLFLATAGFVLRQPSRWTTLLVAIVTVLLWAAERRTRQILESLLERRDKLEGTDPARLLSLLAPENRKHRILSHTWAINLIYLVILVYSVVLFIVGPASFQPPGS
jgi:uncharacterized membrane protein YbhN (UPF0104 family)